MAETCSPQMCRPRHRPGSVDLRKLKCLYKEYYITHAAKLTLKMLKKSACRVDAFYRDTRTQDREYDPPEGVELLAFGPFDPYMYNLAHFGIDLTRVLVFTVAVPLIEDMKVCLKAGDLILYDGQEHEVLTVKRKEDSFFDQLNYCFEWAVATSIPNKGS